LIIGCAWNLHRYGLLKCGICENIFEQYYSLFVLLIDPDTGKQYRIFKPQLYEAIQPDISFKWNAKIFFLQKNTFETRVY
jgi:hypothetical protein